MRIRLALHAIRCAAFVLYLRSCNTTHTILYYYLTQGIGSIVVLPGKE